MEEKKSNVLLLKYAYRDEERETNQKLETDPSLRSTRGLTKSWQSDLSIVEKYEKKGDVNVDKSSIPERSEKKDNAEERIEGLQVKNNPAVCTISKINESNLKMHDPTKDEQNDGSQHFKENDYVSYPLSNVTEGVPDNLQNLSSYVDMEDNPRRDQINDLKLVTSFSKDGAKPDQLKNICSAASNVSNSSVKLSQLEKEGNKSGACNSVNMIQENPSVCKTSCNNEGRKSERFGSMKSFSKENRSPSFLVQIKKGKAEVKPTCCGSPIQKQIFGSIISALGFLANGTVNGWSGGTLSQLDIDFELGPTPLAFIVSSISIGALVGSLGSSKFMDMLGRRKLIVVTSPLLACGWLIMGLAPSVNVLCVGRFLTGISTGVLFSTCQVYISEITHPAIRGKLSSLSSVLLTVGMGLSYTLGSFFYWRISCYCFIAIPVVLFIGMCALPESPYWYLLKGKKDDAIDSLTYYRHPDSTEIAKELSEMELKMNRIDKTVNFKELFKSRTRLPLMSALFCHSAQQFTGCSIAMFYTSDIIEKSGSSLDIRYATSLTGVAQLIATIISLIFVDKLGRKVLLSISSIGCGIFTFLFGVYFLTTSQGRLWPAWLPVVVLFGIVFFYCIGCRSIPFIISSEVFNTAIRSRANSFCIVYNRFLNLVINQGYPYLRVSVGNHSIFFFFGVVSMIMGVTTWCAVYETKGKSLEEIQEYFESRAEKEKSPKSLE